MMQRNVLFFKIKKKIISRREAKTFKKKNDNCIKIRIYEELRTILPIAIITEKFEFAKNCENCMNFDVLRKSRKFKE